MIGGCCGHEARGVARRVPVTAERMSLFTIGSNGEIGMLYKIPEPAAARQWGSLSALLSWASSLNEQCGVWRGSFFHRVETQSHYGRNFRCIGRFTPRFSTLARRSF